MATIFGPQTAVMVQAKNAKEDGWIEVLSMQELYVKGANYRIWSPFGWTDIKLMTERQQSKPMQWMQSRENLVVGEASSMQVLNDPKRFTEVQIVLDVELLPPLVGLIWEYARSSWLVGSAPEDWFRCPLPPAPTGHPSRIPDDEPLMLVCQTCIHAHGFKYHKVVIDVGDYFQDPATGHRFCEWHTASANYQYDRRRNWQVTHADVVNHPSPARYLDAWVHHSGQQWADSCWKPAEVQADVIIVAHAGQVHSISDGPKIYPNFEFHKPTLAPTTDALTRWDTGSQYAFQKDIFHPTTSYSVVTKARSFCAGIGFWAFAC